MYEDYTGFVKFSAEWCGPCKSFAPLLKEVADSFQLKVRDVDIEEDYKISEKYNVKSVPTTIAFLNGEPVDAIYGAVSKNKVEEVAKKISK